MLRVFLGLIKGGIIGAVVGLGAWKLGLVTGALAFVALGLVGGLVGIFGGRPPWKQETIWTSFLKGAFGFLIGMALYWGARKLFGDTHLAFATGLGAPDRPIVELPFLLGPLIGSLYGIFVEVDDSSGAKSAEAPKKS
jgi:hypothetical protein